MASMEELKVGKKIIVDGFPYEVLKSEHLKVAMGKGLEKTVLKNLITGNVIQKTFRENDKVEVADIRYFPAQFLYFDKLEWYVFMREDSYEQFSLEKETLWDAIYFIQEGERVLIQEFNGKPINVQLEPSVVLEVVDTPPGERGDTATGGRKPATLSTWLVVQVPLFISAGDKIKVDTRTKEYLQKVE